MFTAQLCDILKDLPAFAKSPALMSVYVISLGASGKEAEAAKLAAEYAKSPDLSDVQQLRMKLFADILSGHEDLIDKDINASGLTADKKAEVILSAGRQCLL